MLTLDKLDDFSEDPGLRDYVQSTFGGVEQCRKDILRKFSFESKGVWPSHLHISVKLTGGSIRLQWTFSEAPLMDLVQTTFLMLVVASTVD